MKALWLLLACSVMVGCSSDDDKARVLLGEANALNEKTRAEWGKVPVETCIKTETAAQRRIEEIYSKYGATPVANEMRTRALAGSIKGTLNECTRVKKLKDNPPKKPEPFKNNF